MLNHRDPVDDALASLRGRRWPRDYDNNQLKDRIMNEARTGQPGSVLRRRPALAATLALAVLGSVGFAATGGIDMLKGWVFTVEVKGVDGTVTIDFDDVDIQTDSGVTTITIDEIEVEGAVEEGASATITATKVGEDGQTVTDADGGNGYRKLSQKCIEN